MKKYGEVVGSEKKKSVIRIYKEKNGELYPTSLTITASDNISSNVGDMVEVEMQTFLFFASTIFGYLLPFLTVAIAFLIVSPLTDNLLIIEAVLLATLFATYFLARFVASLPFFRRVNVCTVTEIIDLE